MCQQKVNEGLFVSEAGKEGEISVCGLTRFTPTLQRESAYKTKLPALRITDSLQLGGRLNDLIHVPLPS